MLWKPGDAESGSGEGVAALTRAVDLTQRSLLLVHRSGRQQGLPGGSFHNLEIRLGEDRAVDPVGRKAACLW